MTDSQGRGATARSACGAGALGAARLWMGLLVLMGLLAAPGARAQTPPERPAFEVASIKRHTDSGNFQMLTFSKGRLTFRGPVVMLIATAYGLPFNPSRRLSGGPDWIRGREGLYDIDAKGSFPDGLSSNAREERERLMLQALLTDRFKLTMRREMKEMPVYVLLVDKGGPKLEKADISEADCAQAPGARQPGLEMDRFRATGSLEAADEGCTPRRSQ